MKNSTSCVLFSQLQNVFPLTRTKLWWSCNFVKTCPETLLFWLSMSLMNTDLLFHCASLIMESSTTVARYSKVHGKFFRDCTSAIASKIQTDWFGSTPLCSEPFSIMLLKAALFVFTKPSVVAIDQGIEPSSCRRTSLIFSCLDWAITNNLANTCLSAFRMVFLSVLETLVLTENVFRTLFRIGSRKVILLANDYLEINSVLKKCNAMQMQSN